MKFSPVDIYNKEFKKSVVGGYNIDEVEDFLDEIGIAYEKLMKEKNKLKKEKIEISQKLKNYEDLEDKLDSTLARVSETIDTRTEKARKEAQNIINQAHQKAEDRIKEAEKKAQEIIEGANQEASKIINQAREEKKQVSQEMEDKHQETKEEIRNERKKLENIKETRELFELRLKNMIQNIQMILDEENSRDFEDFK